MLIARDNKQIAHGFGANCAKHFMGFRADAVCCVVVGPENETTEIGFAKPDFGTLFCHS